MTILKERTYLVCGVCGKDREVVTYRRRELLVCRSLWCHWRGKGYKKADVEKYLGLELKTVSGKVVSISRRGAENEKIETQ